MKKFILNIAIFTILLAAGASVFDLILENGLRKARTGEFSIWNDIFESKINSDVIISGSSRAWIHISPVILDSILHVNSYNLGIDGYPFNMQSVRFEIFEKYNKKPKLIIQNVDFTTLFRRNLYNKEQFSPYVHESLLKDELLKMGMSEFEFYIPSLQYHSEFSLIKQGLMEFLNLKHYPSGRYKGYCGRESGWDGTALKKVLSQDSIIAKKEPEIIELFDSFLGYCKKNEIQVILVFAPQYIKMTEFTKNWDEEMQVYHNFAAKYNIPFLDYTHDSICYDTTYFYNAMHLNKKGSELFSQKLANDIEEQNLYKK
jgi:hypothetical protein